MQTHLLPKHEPLGPAPAVQLLGGWAGLLQGDQLLHPLQAFAELDRGEGIGSGFLVRHPGPIALNLVEEPCLQAGFKGLELCVVFFRPKQHIRADPYGTTKGRIHGAIEDVIPVERGVHRDHEEHHANGDRRPQAAAPAKDSQDRNHEQQR